jgi:hypothetical protein
MFSEGDSWWRSKGPSIQIIIFLISYLILFWGLTLSKSRIKIFDGCRNPHFRWLFDSDSRTTGSSRLGNHMRWKLTDQCLGCEHMCDERSTVVTGAFLSQVLLASPSLIEADFICTEAIMLRGSNWHVTDSAASYHDTVVTSKLDMKRVWWTLFMVDRWCTSGLWVLRQLNDVGRSTSLPMDKIRFHNPTVNQIAVDNPCKTQIMGSHNHSRLIFSA